MKKFSTSIYGYNKSEVNYFVNEVANEYESMLDNLKKRDAEITALTKTCAISKYGKHFK